MGDFFNFPEKVKFHFRWFFVLSRPPGFGRWARALGSPFSLLFFYWGWSIGWVCLLWGFPALIGWVTQQRGAPRAGKRGRLGASCGLKVGPLWTRTRG